VSGPIQNRLGQLKARDPKALTEFGLAAGGLLLIGLTLHYYPTFGISGHAPSARQTLSSSEADRQVETAKDRLNDNPEDFNAYFALALAYFQKGPEHYVEALNALEKARALGYTGEGLFFYAGVMYDALGLPDYAANEFAKYLRHHPKDYETTIRLANVYYRQKRYDQAYTLYEQAIGEWPNDATAWFNYALIHKQKTNYDDALKALDKAEAIAGHLPEGGSYEKGEIYKAKGDAAKAAEFYQKEITEHPTYIPALEAIEAGAKANGDQKQARELRKRINELKKQQKAQAAQSNG
jgi:tetratricopeptide (TPR) repeat protein